MARSMRGWDTISFDCYGTLVDWESGIADAFIEAAARDGVGLESPREILDLYREIEAQVEAGPFQPYREVLAETERRIAARLDWELDSGTAGFLPRSLPDWPVFADTREALERLKSRFRIAILSNVDDDLLAATIRRIGIDFDFTVTAQQLRSYKPAPGHFHEALHRVAGDRGRLLHAAQSYFHDVIPAAQLGISVVWINRDAAHLPDGPKPLEIFDDLASFADWLES